MSISLYQIEDALQQLVDLREQAEAEGDADALAVIDQQLREYLTQEARKVESYAHMIHHQGDLVEACNRQIERIKTIRDRAANFRDWLKANALAVMQAFGVRELATPTNKLKIQGNGGVQPLEVEWPKDSSGRYELLPIGDPRAADKPVKVFVALDTDRIRNALKDGSTLPYAKLLEQGEHLRVT